MQTQCFYDFDAFAESVGDVDSKMLLRNPERRLWMVSSLDLGGLHLQLGRLGSGNIAQGQLRPDGTMLYFPLTEAIEYSANGAALEKDSFAMMDPGAEFCISTRAAHDWGVIFVPTPMLAHRESQGLASPSRNATVRVSRVQCQVASKLRVTFQKIMSAAAQHQNFESSPAASCATADLLKNVSTALQLPNADRDRPVGRPLLARQAIIARSHEFLEQRGGKTIYVEELAAAADVSERTLRTAFREYFGVGPVRYLQLRQLHHIRSELQAADAESVSVSQILIASGVWEFSRFASRYRQLYGELPSDTLRGKTGIAPAHLTAEI